MPLTERSTAHPTLRSALSEASMLGEQQLQNRYALSLTLYSCGVRVAKVRMKKCLVTQVSRYAGTDVTVVEMSFLAPFQYVASSSCSIFHFNMELSHTRQSDDMMTPHTPIAILLSHLQALYNNIINVLHQVVAVTR